MSSRDTHVSRTSESRISHLNSELPQSSSLAAGVRAFPITTAEQKYSVLLEKRASVPSVIRSQMIGWTPDPGRSRVLSRSPQAAKRFVTRSRIADAVAGSIHLLRLDLSSGLATEALKCPAES